MRDAVAEWILSLVAAPDSAASTVGDLAEETSSRGIVWFWSSLLRTAGSHFWRDLSVSPLRMVWLAAWRVFEGLLIGVLLGVFMVAVRMMIVDSAPAWEYLLQLVVVCIVVPFLVGWRVADDSDGRELAATFAAASVFAAWYVVSQYLSAMQMRQIGKPWPGMEHAFAVLCSQELFVMAGGILFRRRALARRKLAC